jgi:hypothetical protein
LRHGLGRLVPMFLIGVNAGRSGRHVSDHHDMFESRRVPESANGAAGAGSLCRVQGQRPGREGRDGKSRGSASWLRWVYERNVCVCVCVCVCGNEDETEAPVRKEK